MVSLVRALVGVRTMQPSVADLGRAVRRLRQIRRLSIDALADQAGMHPTYLSAIERGQRNPSWAKLCDLAQVSASRSTLSCEPPKARLTEQSTSTIKHSTEIPWRTPPENRPLRRV
jgi:transcriptional regulator with XRE-family HTH domain